MRYVLYCLVLLSLFMIGSHGQSPPVYKGKEEKLPITAAPQPIDFSHKKHAAAGMSCLDCHEAANQKERAGLPDTEKCMICHATIETDSPEVEKLAEFHRQGKEVEWVRVYKEPDFVFFSHSRHLKAGEECATCHGPAHQRDVLAKEVSTSMVTCMNCHAAKKVSNACYTCHELGQ